MAKTLRLASVIFLGGQPLVERNMNNRTKRLARIYLLLLLVPGIFFFGCHAFARPQYISLGTGICAGIATLFGPWATLVAKCTNIPNAGEFFKPWVAGGLTIALLVVIIVSILVIERWVTIVCVGMFALLIFAWLAFGFLQLVACIT
jgi:hypothetical protein